LLIASAGHSQSAPASAIGIGEVIGWLPPTTETLIVARGPIDPGVAPRRPVDAIANFAMGGVVSDGRVSAITHLRGLRLRFAVEGARAYRAPQGFGVAPYDGSHILVFEDSDDQKLEQFMARLGSSGASATVGGVATVRLNWRSEKDDWLAFVAHPRPGVLILATSESMLAETLARSRNGGVERAFPSHLPEWSGLDTTTRVWAVRHYVLAGSSKDPTSPLTSQRRAANHSDTMAVGIALHVVDGDSARVVADYYSTNPQADSIVQQIWRPSDIRSVARSPRGSVHVVLAPTRPELWGDLLTTLLGVLGHAIYM
jgi:hypothetical protein